MSWSFVGPFMFFVVGVGVVIWATERLLEGLVGLARLLRVSTFAIAAILSGFEAENVAVGLAAARREAAELALGTVFGGAIFLICVALGLGAPSATRLALPRRGNVAGDVVLRPDRVGRLESALLVALYVFLHTVLR